MLKKPSELKTLIKSIVPNRMLSRIRKTNPIQKFSSPNGLDVIKDIQEKYGFDGDLLQCFASNTGPIVHKWHHYIPLYDRYFSRFRGKKVRFLEIGVENGGSQKMWRQYFGAEAVIFGIDIDKNCRKLDGKFGRVFIGSQDDETFLKSVVKEMSGLDIVLDDGSHQMTHIRKSLECLFPLLTEGGLYMIEDLHCAYWSSFSGGYNNKLNFFNYTRGVVDDMHRWYHDKNLKHSVISEKCSGIHIHDSIVVLEKSPVYMPIHSRIGKTLKP